ncbi:MAG: M23 family metallopeptidase [Ignavibacteria bacterium]|nr:M23 family metallopeptidase [Ignavibacteria bacterium]MBI3765385.1 M23 family metallopeptidase [Ignavibacteriales bacterium]
MSPENVRERREKRRYTFVVVPNAESKKTRTFSISGWGFVATVFAAFIVIVALVFAAIIYTPVGTHLPISSPEVVKQYGKQIVDIQKQLHVLLQEINVLREYNQRLRRAMGEQMSRPDSIGMITRSLDSALISSRPDESMEQGSREFAGSPSLMGPPGVLPDEKISFGESVRQKNIPFAASLPLTIPAEGFVTRGFDAQEYHFGIDFAGKRGSPVLAAADGNVVFAEWTYDNGFMLMISHDQGFMTVYKHNQSLLKATGESIRRGEMIALLGNTGKTSSGPHLHFEVWKDGIAQDPTNYLLTTQ